MSEFCYAWYSEQAAQEYGYCLYENAAGAHVKVTIVHSSPVVDYRWEDAYFVGIVYKFVKRVDPKWHQEITNPGVKIVDYDSLLLDHALKRRKLYYQASDTLPGSY